jgi:hypothetical protein
MVRDSTDHRLNFIDLDQVFLLVNIIVMLNGVLSNFYERDIRKLIEEISLFRDEEYLWRTQGAVKNSAGNLILHIIGGMNYLIGTMLAQTGYVRDRDQEFIRKNVERKDLVTQLEELILMINKTVNALSQEQMDAEYPIIFDGMKRPTSYVLLQLLAHLNYHLGQVNYLRRALE